MPKIIHSREECIGCGVCSNLAPDFWEMNYDDNKVDLKNSVEKDGKFVLEIPEEAVEQNKSAAESCPIDIIHIYDDNEKDITSDS